MGYKHLNIKKPCDQPLENISGDGGARFCPSCQHVVHDFSEMDNTELIEVLQSKKYSCGIFNKEQLGIMYYVDEETKGKRRNYWSSVAAAIVAGTLQLTTGYSQNPVRTHKLLNKNLAIEKYQTDRSSSIDTPENTTVKKEKFEFTILDKETHAPITYAKVKIMGISGQTDKDGKISFDLVYTPDTLVRFVAEVSCYRYEDEHIKLVLQDCFKKMTVMYIRKQKNNKNREQVYGFF